jgi:hypothetical protein
VIADWGNAIEFNPEDTARARHVNAGTVKSLSVIFNFLSFRHIDLNSSMRPLIDRMQSASNQPTLEECKELLKKLAEVKPT